MKIAVVCYYEAIPSSPCCSAASIVEVVKPGAEPRLATTHSVGSGPPRGHGAGTPFKVQPGTKVAFGDRCLLISGPAENVRLALSALKALMKQLQPSQLLALRMRFTSTATVFRRPMSICLGLSRPKLYCYSAGVVRLKGSLYVMQWGEPRLRISTLPIFSV